MTLQNKLGRISTKNDPETTQKAKITKKKVGSSRSIKTTHREDKPSKENEEEEGKNEVEKQRPMVQERTKKWVNKGAGKGAK